MHACTEMKQQQQQKLICKVEQNIIFVIGSAHVYICMGWTIASIYSNGCSHESHARAEQ